MVRCTQKDNLEVHHKSGARGNGIDDAKVLCQQCHEAASADGTPGKSPPKFSEATKKHALANAGNQCQCESSGGCHGVVDHAAIVQMIRDLVID
jgi:hypothetical protein